LRSPAVPLIIAISLGAGFFLVFTVMANPNL
jgi:hypothetical protein